MLNLFFSSMPMFVCLFWVILLLIDRQQLNRSKQFLVLFLNVSVINYFSHAVFFNHHYQLYTVLDSIWCFTSLAVYPMYYIYIRLLTQDARFEWKWSWVLIPALIVAIFSGVTYILMSPAEVKTFVMGRLYFEPGYEPPYSPLVRLQILRLSVLKVVFILQVIVVVIAGLRHIFTYNAKINNFYSNTGGKDLTPIKWLLVVFIFASVISVLSSGVGKAYFISHPWMLIIPSLTHSLFLFGVGYAGYKQHFTIEHFQQDLNQQELQPEKETAAVHELKNFAEYRSLMFDLLDNKEIYTNHDLRITDVAKMLNTNRSYASRLLNDMFNTNFADLINRYRINKAVELIKSSVDDELSADDVATMSGFASVSSFYRSFKKETGLTPGDYKKNGKEPDSL